jgi:hypothetical protein
MPPRAATAAGSGPECGGASEGGGDGGGQLDVLEGVDGAVEDDEGAHDLCVRVCDCVTV